MFALLDGDMGSCSRSGPAPPSGLAVLVLAMTVRSMSSNVRSRSSMREALLCILLEQRTMHQTWVFLLCFLCRCDIRGNPRRPRIDTAEAHVATDGASWARAIASSLSRSTRLARQRRPLSFHAWLAIRCRHGGQQCWNWQW
jgi:hypothetical protein